MQNAIKAIQAKIIKVKFMSNSSVFSSKGIITTAGLHI